MVMSLKLGPRTKEEIMHITGRLKGKYLQPIMFAAPKTKRQFNV
jgi:hypothetical protein